MPNEVFLHFPIKTEKCYTINILLIHNFQYLLSVSNFKLNKLLTHHLDNHQLIYWTRMIYMSRYKKVNSRQNRNVVFFITESIKTEKCTARKSLAVNSDSYNGFLQQTQIYLSANTGFFLILQNLIMYMIKLTIF